jgi:hypothetical protein
MSHVELEESRALVDLH